MKVSTIASAIFDPPAPRWRSYGVTTRAKGLELWVSCGEHAAIEAGWADGKRELRTVADKAGTIHQWREKVG